MTPEPANASDAAWGRWLDTADAATRQAHPQHYWAVSFTDAPTLYYWDEQPVSRAEYIAAIGEDV